MAWYRRFDQGLRALVARNPLLGFVAIYAMCLVVGLAFEAAWDTHSSVFWLAIGPAFGTTLGIWLRRHQSDEERARSQRLGSRLVALGILLLLAVAVIAQMR